MKRGKRIDLEVLRVIKLARNPISTRKIALKIKHSWHTVDRHCLKLELKSKIRGFKIGNVNAWVKKEL